MKIKSTIQLITPQIAAEMLTHNISNRHLRQSQIEKHIGILQRGEHQLSNDAVTFNIQGELTNGQHRLTAVYRSGIEALFVVITGMPIESNQVMDIGLRRTMQDLIGIPPYYHQVYGQILRLQNSTCSFSSNQMMEKDEIYGHFIEKLRCSAKGTTRTFGASPFRCAAVAHMLDPKNEDYVLHTYKSLVNGDYLEFNPVMQLAVRKEKRTGLGNASNNSADGETLLGNAFFILDPANANRNKFPAPGYSLLFKAQARIMFNQYEASIGGAK